jgi:hypothetical protein
MIHYCSVPPSSDWEEPAPIREQYPAYFPTPPQKEIDEWIVGADREWFPKKPELATAQSLTLEQRFREAAGKWDRETAHLSSTPKMILHDAYQSIMAMGPDVVPLLLRDLQEKRRSWFWALRHLTQANPVRPEDQGNLDKMIAAWVAWGKREGRI